MGISERREIGKTVCPQCGKTYEHLHVGECCSACGFRVRVVPHTERGAVTPSEIVTWLRGRTGAHGGGFTSADDVADAIEREFT